MESGASLHFQRESEQAQERWYTAVRRDLVIGIF